MDCTIYVLHNNYNVQHVTKKTYASNTKYLQHIFMIEIHFQHKHYIQDKGSCHNKSNKEECLK